MEKLLNKAQKVYIRKEEEKQKQKASMMLSIIEQMTQNRAGSQAQGQRAPQGGCQKGQSPKDNQGRKGEIKVTNVVRRGISRENAQIGKKRSR
jgi:hypothetical protein